MNTSAPMVEVARSPMLDLREQEGLRLNECLLHSSSNITNKIIFLCFIDVTFSQHSRVPVSPIALVENAVGLRESARIATGLSTANSRLNINCYDMLHDPMIPKPKDNRFPRPALEFKISSWSTS